MSAAWIEALNAGQVIPAMPLALREDGTWSETHQRALLRYYCAAGAGGIAVGVHSTQFAIRDAAYGLYQPLLKFCTECLDDDSTVDDKFIRIAGICGATRQAVEEAELASQLGYHAGLVSLSALSTQTESELLTHLQTVASAIPIVGFYLQPAVGGRVLSYDFWCRVCEIDRLVAVKIAPFNRYQTLDVVRAVIDAGRSDVALYTGNDDSIVLDLLTQWQFRGVSRFIAGGLLGQWGVWTRAAVRMLRDVQAVRTQPTIPREWLTRNAQLTDANAAIFDAANAFRGCIPGIHEVLRRDGLIPSTRCLNPDEVLSPGQSEEISRVIAAYPELTDTDFVAENLSAWMS